MSITSLPNEILLKIFSKLSQRDLVALSDAYEEWEEVCYEQSFWKHVDVTGKPKEESNSKEVTVEDFLAASKHGMKTSSLNMKFVEEKSVETIFTCCIDNVMPLKQLSFYKCDVECSESVQHLASSVISDNITDITVDPEMCIAEDLYVFTNFQNLEKLDYNVRASIAMQYCIVPECPNLRELTLNGVSLYPRDITEILEYLPKLKKLVLDDCSVKLVGQFEKFKGNQTLESLFIRNTFVFGSYYSSMDYTPLFTLPNLKTLNCDMIRTEISPQIMLEGCSTRINHLWLHGMKHDFPVTDELLRMVANRFPSLESFYVSSDHITDVGISNFLSTERNLKRLFIYLFGSTNVKGDSWTTMVAEHTALETVTLQYVRDISQENKTVLESSGKQIHFLFDRVDDDFGSM